jgi:hypothetical protein
VVVLVLLLLVVLPEKLLVPYVEERLASLDVVCKELCDRKRTERRFATNRAKDREVDHMARLNAGASPSAAVLDAPIGQKGQSMILWTP